MQWDNFLSFVVGFVDTLQVSRKNFQKDIHTNSVLMCDLIHETYMADNALGDVNTLQKLAELVKSKFPENTFGPGVVLNSVNAARNKTTLEPSVQGRVISNCMTSKIAKSSFNYHHLKAAMERNGSDGLCAYVQFLGEKVNEVVHVTKHGQTFD